MIFNRRTNYQLLEGHGEVKLLIKHLLDYQFGDLRFFLDKDLWTPHFAPLGVKNLKILKKIWERVTLRDPLQPF